MNKKAKKPDQNKGHRHPDHDKKKRPTNKEDLRKVQGGAFTQADRFDIAL